MESGVEFVAADMPTANRFMLHVMAAVAEHEREMISQRTKAALAAAKARGTRPGNPRPDTAKARAAKAERVSAFQAGVQPQIRALQAEGWSLRGIAAELNRKHIYTSHGDQWHPATIKPSLMHLS